MVAANYGALHLHLSHVSIDVFPTSTPVLPQANASLALVDTGSGHCLTNMKKTKKCAPKRTHSEDSELPDNWRYTYSPDWKMDSLHAARHEHQSEDDIIDQIDEMRELQRGASDDSRATPSSSTSLSAIEQMEDILSERHYNIVYWHLWEGLTFQQISEKLGVNRARAHQLYKNALAKLKAAMKEKE